MPQRAPSRPSRETRGGLRAALERLDFTEWRRCADREGGGFSRAACRVKIREPSAHEVHAVR